MSVYKGFRGYCYDQPGVVDSVTNRSVVFRLDNGNMIDCADWAIAYSPYDACDDAPFGSGDRVWFYDSELVVIHSSYRDASGIRYVIWHEDGTLKACRDEHLFAEPTNATRHAYESLIGRTIVDVRSMTPDEVNRIWGGEGWGHILVVLDDGTEFTPSRDDEGNGPGTIFVSPWDSEDD